MWKLGRFSFWKIEFKFSSFWRGGGGGYGYSANAGLFFILTPRHLLVFVAFFVWPGIPPPDFSASLL